MWSMTSRSHRAERYRICGGKGRCSCRENTIPVQDSRTDRRIKLTPRSAIFLVSSQNRSAPDGPYFHSQTSGAVHSTGIVNEWSFYDLDQKVRCASPYFYRVARGSPDKASVWSWNRSSEEWTRSPGRRSQGRDASGKAGGVVNDLIFSQGVSRVRASSGLARLHRVGVSRIERVRVSFLAVQRLSQWWWKICWEIVVRLVLFRRFLDGLCIGLIPTRAGGFLSARFLGLRLLRRGSLLVRELLACAILVCSAHILSLRWFGWTHLWRVTDQRIFTARAASSATVANEISACTIIMSLAHRDRTGTSVGENAVLVLKARNR